jgi:aspartyl-tRNA(Asn)/glutamyl-tRNA(Gln) amidotransferase subunit C
MTKISKVQIEKITNLARIELTELEQENLSNKLSNIVSWVEKLNEVDTTGVEPMFAVFDELRMREDEETCGNQVDKVLANAPDKEYNFFAVPKVISEGE